MLILVTTDIGADTTSACRLLHALVDFTVSCQLIMKIQLLACSMIQTCVHIRHKHISNYMLLTSYCDMF